MPHIVRLPLVVAVFGPSITLVSPLSGEVGQPVRIDGYNFGSSQGLSTLTFNGVSAPVSLWSDKTILCTVPSTTSGFIVINRPGFQVASAQFTVTGSPQPFNFYSALPAQGGSNSNNGLFPTPQGGNNGPFATINFGMDALSAGQALGVRGGIWNEFFVNPALVSGISASQRTKVGNYNNENVIIRPTGSIGAGTTFDLNGNAPYSFLEFFGINLDGSLVTNYNNVLNMVGKDPNTGGSDVRDIIWRDCSITGKPNTHHFGCIFSGVSSSVVNTAQWNVLGKRHWFRNLFVRDGGGIGRFTHPIYLTGDEAEVSGCDIGFFRGFGIHPNRNNGVPFNGLKFFKNVVHDAIAKIDAESPAHVGIGVFRNGGIAYDNLVYNMFVPVDGVNGCTGISMGGLNNQAYSNTIVNCGRAIDAFGSGSNPYTVRNNLTFGNTGSDGIINGGSGQIASNNSFGVNPQFAGGNNYHLTAATPTSIKTGGLNISSTITGAGMPYSDLDNVNWQNPPSIGCYQSLL